MTDGTTSSESRRWVLFGLLALGVSLAIYIGAGRIAAARDAAQPPREETLPLVETVKARLVPQRFSVTEEGFLRPRAQIDVIPEVSGRIVEVAPQLSPGGRFEEGELMFRIDPRTFEADLRQAQAELARVEADSSRVGRLAEIGAVSEARSQQTDASLAGARAAVINAEKRLDDTRVTAPFAASVISESVAMGRFVQPGTAVATIFDTGAAEIVVGLLPNEAAAVRAAARRSEEPLDVLVKPSRASATAAALTGRLKQFGSAVDARSRTVPVVIEVEDAFRESAEADVFANDFVEVEIPAYSDQQLYAAPAGTVREERYVWILDAENRLERVDAVPVERTASEVVFRTQADLLGSRLVLTALTEEAEGLKVEVAGDDDRQARLK